MVLAGAAPKQLGQANVRVCRRSKGNGDERDRVAAEGLALGHGRGALLYARPSDAVAELRLADRFVWQTLDLAPAYPRIHRFLDFWRREIDAVIHSVQLATGEQLAPGRVSPAAHLLHH
jgi:uncharacterized protein Usg